MSYLLSFLILLHKFLIDVSLDKVTMHYSDMLKGCRCWSMEIPLRWTMFTTGVFYSINYLLCAMVPNHTTFLAPSLTRWFTPICRIHLCISIKVLTQNGVSIIHVWWIFSKNHLTSKRTAKNLTKIPVSSEHYPCINHLYNTFKHICYCCFNKTAY